MKNLEPKAEIQDIEQEIVQEADEENKLFILQNYSKNVDEPLFKRRQRMPTISKTLVSKTMNRHS
jgi:hypothetical protein